MNVWFCKRVSLECLLVGLVTAFVEHASAQTLTVHETETEFLASAEIESIEDFDGIPTETYIVEPAVVIDDVVYGYRQGGDSDNPPPCPRYGPYGGYCWVIGGRYPVTLPNSLFATGSYGPRQWDSWQVVSFGEGKMVSAVGFHFISTALYQGQPDWYGWEIIVQEADGKSTNVFLPPTIAAPTRDTYRGFVSSTGITKLEFAAIGPDDASDFLTSSFSYDDVARARIVDVALDSVKVNAWVRFRPRRSTYRFADDTTGCPAAAAGKFSFEARLVNRSRSVLSQLYFEVTELARGNTLLTSGGGTIDAGDVLPVAKTDGYSDGYLGPRERVDVPFTICLEFRQPFRFVVDVLGKPQ